MHARQRNVGNGYRSGPIGMGMSASRISPDHRHGFYGSGGFDREYGRGRGRSKPYQTQLPPSSVQRRSDGDIFMDAGRLAAEYLVCQGVLPQTVLSSKWQDGNFRKQTLGFQAPATDKRRYIDGYSSAGSRNSLKERRRSGSWSEKNKAFDSVSGNSHREEQPLAEDIASSVEFMRKYEGAGDSESVLDKYSLQDEAQSKTGSSSAGKEIVQDCELSKVDDGSSSLSAGSREMKGSNGGDKVAIADESFTKSGIDLATLCKFGKVPTRTRSSLTVKGPKIYTSQNIKDISGVLEEDQTKNQTRGQSSGQAGDETLHDQVEDLALVQSNSKCHRSISFPNTIPRDNSEKDYGLKFSNLHRSHSVGRAGEKRAGEGSDLEEGAKRQRDWVPLPVSGANEHLDIIKRSEIKWDLEKEDEAGLFNRRLIDDAAGKTVTHDNLVSNFTGNTLQKGISGPRYAEERPALFKICDLNLGGASDVNVGKRESGQGVDFDLSVSSSSKSLEFSTSTRMSNGKEIEVIDLDNEDSPEVVKSSNNPGRKQEGAPYMGINDVPDYNEGLMMVEYLDSFGNITPVNPEISTGQTVTHNNAVGLQDHEGATGNDQVPNNADDDSIFMSLGEIPLTFLHAWDQPPTRGYNKPF